MEKFLVRLLGVVWIGMIVFLSLVIAKTPSKCGETVGFLLMSIGMTYFHFSGQFDPKTPSIKITAQHC